MSNNGKRWFKLFSDCILVDGVQESLLYDLGRNSSYPLDAGYAGIIRDLECMDIDAYKEASNFSPDEIDSFIDQFLKEELAFITLEPESFPAISVNWESPYLVSCAILEIDQPPGYNIEKVLSELNEILVQAIEFRFTGFSTLNDLEKYIALLDNSTVNSVDLVIPHVQGIHDRDYFKLIIKFPRIRRVFVYEADKDIVVDADDILLAHKLVYSKKTRTGKHNHLTEREAFMYNVPSFCEATNYNLGLNQKVSITRDGFIKNHITHESDYGHVDACDLKSVICDTGFKQKWAISNDKIEKCKDCQFRYACSSNSDIETVNNRYYKKQLCKYDPYKNIWSD